MAIGRPRLIADADTLYQYWTDYLQDCNTNDKMPNIAGFCCYMGVSRDCYYDMANNTSFCNAIKRIDIALEDAVLNNKSQHDLIKLAYLNNKHGYRTETFVREEKAEAKPEDIQRKIDELTSALKAENPLPKQAQTPIQ